MSAAATQLKYSTIGKETLESTRKLFFEGHKDLFSGVSTLLDCGSGAGAFSLILASESKELRAYAYDGYHRNFENLLRNIDENSLYRVVADDHHIHFENGRSLMHVENGVVNDLGRGTKLMIETVCIDCLMVPEPDLIKITVPGAAPDVLRGGLKTISKEAPVLIVEVCSPREEKEVREIISGLGYSSRGREEATRLDGISSVFLFLEKT